MDFVSPKTGAIVNAANEQCLGGGGVDGAISAAGGGNLARDRHALPLISKKMSSSGSADCRNDGEEEDDEFYMQEEVRCPTGGAVITGPGDYGALHVPFVIHAVGPNYHMYNGFETADRLLRAAYQSSLDRCREKGITEVAFALLSAGVFRGRRQPEEILRIGVTAIRDWSQHDADDNFDSSSSSLKSITLCGFSDEETAMLLDACETELSKK